MDGAGGIPNATGRTPPDNFSPPPAALQGQNLIQEADSRQLCSQKESHQALNGQGITIPMAEMQA